MARKSAKSGTTSGASSSTAVTSDPSSTTTPTTSTSSSPPPELPEHLKHLLSTTIPQKHLSTLLELRTTALNPQNAKLTHLSSTMVSITFDQPVRQYWFNPIPQIAHITLRDLPSPLPKTSSFVENSQTHSITITTADGQEETKMQFPPPTRDEILWAKQVAKAVDDAAHNVHATKITHYAPPASVIELLGVVVFLAFTLCIVAWIMGVRGALEKYVFKTEGRFNMAVIVHAVVLVKRSKDAKRVGELMRAHWKGGYLGWLAWMISAWIEGWRTVGRVLREVEKVESEKEGKKGN
ncbi:hypothetical protein EX30DRAFT_337158 [Ascodesmis nigricans]|uniref:Uncharacterized protein n=1 Tax=Ascodesmis nigricans TaxID=341454 RepID=A0A4S2N5Y2_9PEZI|nr:hypothetical protein EX30DRAFT_337158 [Ascodesmis nigricans]